MAFTPYLPVAAALALSLVSGAASGGEIYLLDPAGGTATLVPQTPPGRDAATEARTGLDRARDRLDPTAPGGVVVVQPAGRGPAGSDARRAAREAAGRLDGGDDDDIAVGGVRESGGTTVIILNDGTTARVVNPGDAVDSATRMGIDVAKARSYLRGDKPCGSVVVGGVENGAAGTAASKDVYVTSNCR